MDGNLMNERELKQFTEILATFDTAMLVTQRGRELRSRPMAIADRTGDGRVWFITNIDSAKLEELTENPEVNVAMQADSKFLSISGTVRATRDRDKVDDLWKESYGIWFSEGRDDPALVLLEIVPTYVEYWDRSGVEALKFIFSAVTGDTPDESDVHGKLDFPKTENSATRSARN
jgi:general stress protein 26